MRYAYNEVGRLINGVIFFFEKGDTEIAIQTFEVIKTSKQLPTSIAWNGGNYTTPQDVLSKLHQRNTLDSGFLGVTFTIDESQLLREYLDFLKEEYPNLLSLTNEIDSRVFGTRH